MLTDDSEAGVRHAAVRWVAGMTDRYAINCAQDWLGFDAEALPAVSAAGLGTPTTPGSSPRETTNAFAEAKAWCRDRPCSVGQDVDQLAALAGAELHHAVGLGEQRVVAADTDVLTRVELGAALTDDDRASGHDGAVVDLDTEALGVGVTPVLVEPPPLVFDMVDQPFVMPVISMVLNAARWPQRFRLFDLFL